MNRRNLLQRLFGVAVAASVPAMAEPKPETMTVMAYGISCTCGHMYNMAIVDDKARRIASCGNPHCPKFGVKFEVPTIQVKVVK